MHDQRDLQATQPIISLFESSKAQIENALDSLPGIYVVIETEGRILKGNKPLGELFGTDHEKVLGMNLSDLLPPEGWQLFRSSIDTLSKGAPFVEFQADLIPKGQSRRSFLWYAILLKTERKDLPLLFSIFGRDVTALNEATAKGTRMEMELSTAQALQNTLLPPSTAEWKTSSIAGYYQSASECGGDWWYYNFFEEKAYFWIGDVTGHGVGAALVTSAVRSAVSIIEKREFTPSEALEILNSVILETTKEDKFMTFGMATFDLMSGEGIYTSAAHEPPLLLLGGKDLIGSEAVQQVPMKKAMPLGYQAGTKYTEHRFQMKRGDRLFFYTDGLYDLEGPEGPLRNRKNFRNTLASLAAKYPGGRDFVGGLREEVEKNRLKSPLNDDVTFFVFTY